MKFQRTCLAVVLGMMSPVLCLPSFAQEKAADSGAATALPALPSDYPRDRVGVLIGSPDWLSISAEIPARLHMKHALAPALTYGIAPAATVTEYQGLHALVKVEPGQPVICICHILSLPGSPTLVRLHPKKDIRELNTGKLHIGGKAAQADKGDLIPSDVSQPEGMVWLVQPRQPLEAGEYALMLGTQNMNIFSFTVVAGAPSSVTVKQ